jgi:hypothetical protein
VAEAATGKVHSLRNFRKHAPLPKNVRDQSHFAEPGRR